VSTRRRRRVRRLDGFAACSPMHALIVGVVRLVLPIAFALAVGYGLIAASPLLGQLLAGAMTQSSR
jgi:hypothetical protein